MKKTMMAVVLILSTFVLNLSTQAQTAPEKQSLIYAGGAYEGGWGLDVGAGFSLGRVSVMPYTRFTFDAESEASSDGSAGIEIGYFPFGNSRFAVGLLAGAADVDWLENQNRDLLMYITQAAGVMAVWQVKEPVGLAGWVKGRAQLFKQETLFKDRFVFGLAVFGKI